MEGDFFMATPAFSFLRQETENRNQLEPTKRFSARSAFWSAAEMFPDKIGFLRVVSKNNDIQKTADTSSEEKQKKIISDHYEIISNSKAYSLRNLIRK